MNFMQPGRTRLYYGILLTLGLVWIWLSATPINYTSNYKIQVPQAGFTAPDFTLKTLDNQTVTLSSLHGKVVLINIWTSWCPPCRAEMPTIERIYQNYKGKGFVILAVNSTGQDKISNVRAFVLENKLSFPILLDEDGLVTRQYLVRSLPTSFFIRADGTISEVVVGGPMAEALIISRVEKLLQEAK